MSSPFNAPRPYIHPLSAPSPAPVATGGSRQPASPRGPKITQPKVVKVKAHTRVVKPRTAKVRAAAAPADPYATPINAALNAKYGPQVAATQQAITNAQYGQMRATNWFHDYQNMLQAQAAAQNTGAANLAHALGAQTPTPVSTGNAQADALAAQAAQSQGHLGQAFAGTQGQMALDTANRFATGLIPGAALQGENVVEGLGNTIQALRGAGITGMKGLQELASERGVDATNLRGQLQAADQKNAVANQKNQIAAKALGVKIDTLNNVTKPLAQSLINNRTQGQKTARSKLRATKNQNAVNNALKVNNLELKSYLAAHPELKGKNGTTVQKTYTQGIHRGAAILRLLHGTPPAKDSTGSVTKPNPFYNLNPQQLGTHKQDLIDMLQTSSKAGHLTLQQATKAVNVFLKEQGGSIKTGKSNQKNLGQIVAGVLQHLA